MIKNVLTYDTTIYIIDYEEKFLLIQDLNFDNYKDLLIFSEPIPWHEPAYNCWTFDKDKKSFIYNGDFTDLFSGTSWSFDTSKKELNLNYGAGCLHCYNNDVYKYIDSEFVLIERWTSYDWEFGRMAEKYERLVNGYFQIIPPYSSDNGISPIPGYNSGEYILMSPIKIQEYEDIESSSSFLNVNDTIIFENGELIFNEFGKAVVIENMKLFSSFDKKLKNLAIGDTLLIFFLDDGDYEYWSKGEYYYGKPFWANEKILDLNNYNVTGILLKEPEIIWWLTIKDNKGKDGYIKFTNSEISYSNMKEKFRLIKK